MEIVFTESGQVVLEVVGEMVALPGGFIVELDVYDVVGILISRFDHANQIEGYSRNESGQVRSVNELQAHLGISVCPP